MSTIPLRHIKDLEHSERFNIRDIEALLSGKDMMHELHRHDFFFVLVLEKGAGNHSIDFISYAIHDYSVFFLRPGQVHQLQLKNGSSGYLMEFNADFFSSRGKAAQQVLRKVSTKNYCQAEQESVQKLLAILRYISKEYSDKKERYTEIIKANLEIFFIELARQSKNPDQLAIESSSYAQEKFEELLELIEAHVAEKKHVSDYADMLHLTSYQLNAITKELSGKTCSELINEYIILEAKRYLQGTSNQINQIAYQLGYEDASYFIRFFKKHTGSSPEAFRKELT